MEAHAPERTASTPNAAPGKKATKRTYKRFEVVTADDVRKRVESGDLRGNARVLLDLGDADGADVRAVLKSFVDETQPDNPSTYAGTGTWGWYEKPPNVEDIPAHRKYTFE